MQSIEDKKVATVFHGYPEDIRQRLLQLRSLIFETASETEGVGAVQETLKWGEPSYITAESRSGSTVRIAWSEARPGQFGMYFNCNTRLVDTFRELHAGRFKFDGNRAIIFNQGDTIPELELKQCIALALTYHRVKHLPLLGA